MLPRWRQTLVFGNGFDLQCGLNSKFSDFYESRRERLYEIAVDNKDGQKFGNRLKTQGLTMWDIILDVQSGNLWCDIEGVITEWISNPNRIRKLINYIASTQDDMPVSSYSDLHAHITKLDKDNLYAVVAQFLFNVYPYLLQDHSELTLCKIIQNELNNLEDCFNNYLFDQVTANTDYQSKALRLFSDIAMKGTPSTEGSFIDTSVLSFNYTTPELRWEGQHASVHTINIHGKLNEGIIFGIDGKGRMGNKLALPFTKTYRLMSRKRRVRYDASYTEHDALICGKVDAIKFYGHSLSEADYSYFQAMFDAADIYSSSTVLAFYFRPCSKDEAESIRSEVMKNAISLLSTYGATLDNKDHGNNLIHKMLLEDRLFVECVR